MAIRARVRRNVSKKSIELGMLEDLVHEASSLVLEIEQAQARVKELMPIIEMHLKEAGLAEFKASNGGRAYHETPSGRSTSVIDPAKYRKLVSDRDFMASVSVLKKNAEKFLGSKELGKITTTYPPAPKEPVLKIDKATS